MATDAEVIKAAASSPLGILALMVIVLSTITLAFFRNTDVRIKMTVFVLLLAGVAGFAAVTMLRSAAPMPTPMPAIAKAAPIPKSAEQPNSERNEGVGYETTVSATGNDATAIGTVNGDVTIE
jgi:hypothetical protein